MRKGQLYGFAAVELPIGVRIYEIPVLIGREGPPWACLPSRPQFDRDGRQRRETDGRSLTRASWGGPSRRLDQAFSARVVSLVRHAHPADLMGAR